MNDVVWSVNILLGIGLIGVAWVIYKILLIANEETSSTNSDHSSPDHK